MFDLTKQKYVSSREVIPALVQIPMHMNLKPVLLSRYATVFHMCFF